LGHCWQRQRKIYLKKNTYLVYAAGTSELLDESISTDSVLPDFRSVDVRTNVELYQDIKPLKSEEEPGSMPLPHSADSRLTESRAGSAEGQVRVLEDLCPVCNDKVSGYHYGLQTCESCKGIAASFFICLFGHMLEILEPSNFGRICQCEYMIFSLVEESDMKCDIC
jgi:hypothetical protein